MRCYENRINQEECKKQIDKAKGHLFRAGYDAYELLGIEATTKIKSTFSKYDPSVIIKVFPNYYETVYPQVSKFEEQLVIARANKDVGYNFYNDDGEIDVEKIQNAFTAYENIVTELLVLKDEVITKIPALEQAKVDSEQEKKADHYKELIIAIMSAIIGAIISKIL